MIRSGIISSVVFSAALALSAPESQAAGAAAGKCLSKFNEIVSTGHHWIAFAGNNPNSNGQSCGWTQAFPSKEAAKAKAMSECKVSEKGHPTWGVTGTCHLLVVK